MTHAMKITANLSLLMVQNVQNVLSQKCSIFRRKFDLVMPLSRIFYFPDNVFFLPETVQIQQYRVKIYIRSAEPVHKICPV